ncbi:CheY-like receiver protein [alpha proteobacterium BAL199]|jgi:two-component system, chemotaxis family, chemotaxis protein CheY|nr:CheY-like receiver protein [alpha proteobacterium BAL199]
MADIFFPDLRVVVIEDEEFTRKIIVRGLRTLGVIKVHEASDGSEGLKVVATVRPNLVLCDIHMEPVDGFQFLDHLRKLPIPAIASTPVVFLTADAEQHTVLAAKKLRVNGYLVKPVSVNQLQKRIESALAS